jgi:hypothetical protein
MMWENLSVPSSQVKQSQTDVNINVIGSSSAISASKTVNITAIRKNLDENRLHAEYLFSRSSLIFFESRIASTAAVVIIIIYLVFHKLLDWKSSILVLDKYCFILLISRLRHIRIVKLHLQSSNIKLLLQI